MIESMATDIWIILVATLPGSLLLGLLLCLRISAQCRRVVRMARITSEAAAITDARRRAVGLSIGRPPRGLG